MSDVAPTADKLLRCRDCPLCATSGQMHRSKHCLYSITSSARDVVEFNNRALYGRSCGRLPEARELGRRSCGAGAARREGRGDALRVASVFWLTGKSTTITALGGI